MPLSYPDPPVHPRTGSAKGQTTVTGGQVSGSAGLEIFSCHLAVAAIGGKLELELLAFAQHAHAGALNSADVDERIRAAVVRLNEAEALLNVEPFDSSGRHWGPFHERRYMLAACHSANERVRHVLTVELALIFGIKCRGAGCR